jgi:hypothetical protein
MSAPRCIPRFRLFIGMGKIRGTPCTRSRILVHGATTNSSAKSFSFRSKIEKEGLARGSTSALGAGGLEFKSRRPDQIFLRH